LSINHLMLTLQRGGKAANDAFVRENKNEDDHKVLEDAIMIMAALRKQAPFKGTGKTKRDLQGVLKGIKRLEMPQGDWVQDSWKKSKHRCKPKSTVTRTRKHQTGAGFTVRSACAKRVAYPWGDGGSCMRICPIKDWQRRWRCSPISTRDREFSRIC
jgi:hypothetical protein